MLSNREGDEGRLVAGEKVVSSLLEVPAVILVDALEASSLKATRELGFKKKKKRVRGGIVGRKRTNLRRGKEKGRG